MSGLVSWAGNILFFLVLITVMENLLPGKKYNSYLRLCAGMVLILLVLKPIIGGFHLEDEIIRCFEAASFRQEAQDLSREILGIENQRLEQVIDSYEQVVEKDIDAMAREMGIVPVWTRVTIDRDTKSETYGTVVQIRMEAGRQDEGGEDTADAVQAVNPVEPVSVALEGQSDREAGGEPEEREQEEYKTEVLEQLKRKVGNYYGLETGKVEIQFQGK